MADITITPGSVKPSAFATTKQGTAGETILAGAPIYVDSNDRKIKLADANAGAEKSDVKGVALTGSSLDQPILYATKDPQFDLGTTVGNGQVVILSANPGKMAPDVDAASGWTKVILGVGLGGSKINLQPFKGGTI